VKNNQAIITFSIIAIIVIGVIVLKRTIIQSKARNKWTIGILQTASHPALDAAREGFVKTLQEKLGNDIGFIIGNGQGSISTLHTIAQQFHAHNDIDGIYAIATPAAQAVTSIEKEKPIIMAAVTITPESTIHFNADNICGVSDMINVKAEIEAMNSLIPHLKTVGILFNTAEINSVTVSKLMVKELEQLNITPVIAGITSESDIEPAVISTLRKVDALIAPTDNTVANTIALITDLSRKASKPLIISDNMLVKYGPLMARGVDYYESGKQAAQIAIELLINKKKPYELPIVSAESKSVFINAQTLAHLNLVIPETLQSDVVMVESTL